MNASRLRASLYLIVFLSGFCSLVYQVAWLRLMRLIFGASTAASAAVVAIFMGGLGLGGWFFGRRLRRESEPLALYAKLEAGIAITAAISPLLVFLARELYLGLGGVGTLGLWPATILRLLLATLVLGGSTTLMGGTLPAVCQALKERAAGDEGRRQVARLYGANTLGAVLGAFAATFLLLEIFGIRQTLWLVALINLLLATMIRALARQEIIDDLAPPSTVPESSSAEQTSKAPPTRTVAVVAGVVGFLFFMMEIVWYRMLAPILGGSSFTFGLILALALAGIGLGGLLYAVRGRATLAALALTCTLEAVCLLLPFAFGDGVALFADMMRDFSVWGFSGLILSWTTTAGLVVVPASIVAGYQFPLLIGLLGSENEGDTSADDEIGRDVGMVYAWNTWGAILGSLAGGFGFLPLLTAPRLWWACGLLLIASGGAAGLLHLRRGGALRPLSAATATGVFALLLCLADGPSAFWRHTAIGAGRAVINTDSPNDFRAYRNDVRRRVLAEAEGVESSVALVGTDDLSLVINGKSDGSARGDGPTQVLTGLIGAALHPDPRRSLVIGFGTGATAGWMAKVPSMEQVDIVELEPAVVDLAAPFAPLNLNVLEAPNAVLRYGDGREDVLARDARYDIIFSEPSNPYRAGVADLFSQDFYRAVSDRLEEDGILLQWLQGYEVDPFVVRSVYATIRSVFPYVETWMTQSSDLLLVATHEPIRHDPASVAQSVASEPWNRALQIFWGVQGVEGFYTGFVGGPRLADAIADEGEISTDDRPMIEFGFARNVGRTGLFDPRVLIDRARTLKADAPIWTAPGPVDGVAVDELRRLRSLHGSLRVLESDDSGLPEDAAARTRARTAYAQERFSEALENWSAQSEPPRHALDVLLLAESLAASGDARAEPWIAQAARLSEANGHALQALLASRSGRPQAAADAYALTAETLRQDGFASKPLMSRALVEIKNVARAHPAGAQKLFRALAEPFALRFLDSDRMSFRISLIGRLPDVSECPDAFAPLEPYPAWERILLEARLRCYEAVDHPLLETAWDDWELFLSDAGENYEDSAGP